MPPKRARATEDPPPEVVSPRTEQRRARAEEKQRAALASRRAILKGGNSDTTNIKEKSPEPSPTRKKGKVENGKEGAQAHNSDIKFNPLLIIAQAGSSIVPVETFDPLELDSLQLLGSESFSQLSPGMGNLSLHKSSDSPNLAVGALHAIGEGVANEKKDGRFADGLEGVLGLVVKAFKKTAKNDGQKKGPNSLNAPYTRDKCVMGKMILTNVLCKAEEVALLERTYSAAELVLLSSPAFPLESMYRKAIASTSNTRISNERVGVKQGMSLNQCLAWLARAGCCSIESLIPKGEYYLDAEQYLSARLVVPTLKLFADANAGTSQIDWTAFQVTRCMYMMAAADLSPLQADDRCILLFAIGMLYIDDSATEEMRIAAHSLVRNVLLSHVDTSKLLENFFTLTPLIAKNPDEAHKWMFMLKASGKSCSELLLSIAASHFMGERAECIPTSFHYSTPADTLSAYVNVISETMNDAFARYAHRRCHRSLLSMLNMSLTPSAIKACDEKSRKSLLKCIDAVRSKMNPDLSEDAIVITELRTLERRLEIFKGRRTSEEETRLRRRDRIASSSASSVSGDYEKTTENGEVQEELEKADGMVEEVEEDEEDDNEDEDEGEEKGSTDEEKSDILEESSEGRDHSSLNSMTAGSEEISTVNGDLSETEPETVDDNNE